MEWNILDTVTQYSSIGSYEQLEECLNQMIEIVMLFIAGSFITVPFGDTTLIT